MDYSYIAAPIIGAIIGYSTNWIAVKMMFRPRKAIKIGKITLPFTPGIIPKNRENIAQAISNTISNNLLTEQDLRKTLLSEEMKEKIKESINAIFEDNDERLGSVIEREIGKENLVNLSIKASNKISSEIYKLTIDKKLGHILSEQIRQAVGEKMNSSIFAVFGGAKILNPIMESLELKINEYITNNGETLVHEIVENEINGLLNKEVSEVIIPNEEFYDITLELYEKIVVNRLPTILSKIDIEKIIRDKINSMDIIELENLVLKVMKKELNAIVNLGALIGLILGMINLLF